METESDIVKKIISKHGYLPRSFYVGMGKTGSSSLCAGCEPHCVQWHQEHYFDRIYGSNFFKDNDLDLYDLIKWIGSEYNFTPLVIESVREPISYIISNSFQHLKSDRNMKYSKLPCECKLCDWKKNKERTEKQLLNVIRDEILKLKTNPILPYSLNAWDSHFNINLLESFSINNKYYYGEFDKINAIILRYEDIVTRESIFKNLGYDFKSLKLNKTENSDMFKVGKFYENIKKNPTLLRLKETDLDIIYASETVRSFYSVEEIINFKSKFM